MIITDCGCCVAAGAVCPRCGGVGRIVVIPATPDALAAFAKIKGDLDWRGPGGRMMNFAVLERRLAEEIGKTHE